MNDDIHDLSGAYALDALDDLERARFEQHLAKCPTCQHDVSEFRRAATHLGRSAAEAPPAHLRASILGAVAETRQERPVADFARARRGTPWLAAVASVAAALVIGVLSFQLLDTRSRLGDTESLAAVLSATDAVIVPLHGETGSGRMVWSPSHGRSVLVLDGMPDVAKGRALQLWYVVGEEPIPAGVYQPDGHRVVAEAGDMPEGIVAIGVTEEAATGSTVPTGPMLVAGEVAAATA